MSREVIVRDEFYRLGKEVRQRRWIGGVLIFDIGSPVVAVDCWNLQSAWTTLVKLPAALMKEGPKSLMIKKSVASTA